MKVFELPDLGEGLVEAEIREWYVHEGDIVTVDQPLVSMETAKAVVDVPSPYAGKILQLHGKVNDVVSIGSPLVSFVDEADTSTQKNKNTVVGSVEESTVKLHDDDIIIGSANKRAQKNKILPAARVLAQQLNVDINHIKGSGAEGLITVADVQQAVRGASPLAVFDLSAGEKVHGVRRMMAQTMAYAHREVVPVTICADADVSHLQIADLTVQLLRAMVAAVKIEPVVNAWFDGQALMRQVFVDKVHIGLAIDSPEGLFVPVLRDVQSQSAETLRAQIEKLKKGVYERTLTNQDMQGATISLSNFGTIIGRYATPIVVPPMVAILGCGRSVEAAVVKDGAVKVGRIMPLSLTVDHRAVTGGEAARYLRAVIENL